MITVNSRIQFVRLTFANACVAAMFAIVLAPTASSQIQTVSLQTVSIERLHLDRSFQWGHPTFSPDGQKIFFTTTSFQGIWEYTLNSKLALQVTADANAGYGFAISPDGKNIAYRRTSYDDETKERLQEIIVINLSDGASAAVAVGDDLSLPAYLGEVLFITVGVNLQSFGLQSHSEDEKVLGIENTKIAVLKDGKKRILDPFGDGSYIWPSLSPDGNSVLAYEIGTGTFISDLQGNVQTRLGRKDAPIWSRDGNWIIYMDDKDDGHQIVSSDILAVSRDNNITVKLTDTRDVIELYPQHSSTENRIVCGSLDGSIYLISYEEIGR